MLSFIILLRVDSQVSAPSSGPCSLVPFSGLFWRAGGGLILLRGLSGNCRRAESNPVGKQRPSPSGSFRLVWPSRLPIPFASARTRESPCPFVFLLLLLWQWRLAAWGCWHVYPSVLREVKSYVLPTGFSVAQGLWPQTLREKSSPRGTWRQVRAPCRRSVSAPHSGPGKGGRDWGLGRARGLCRRPWSLWQEGEAVSRPPLISLGVRRGAPCSWWEWVGWCLVEGACLFRSI